MGGTIEEQAAWGEEYRKAAKLAVGSPNNDGLVKRFPELMRAGGGVDPQEAIVSLLDKIAELEAKIDGIQGNSEAD